MSWKTNPPPGKTQRSELTKKQAQCLRDCQDNAWHSMLQPMTLDLKRVTIYSLAERGYLETRNNFYRITEDGREWRRKHLR